MNNYKLVAASLAVVVCMLFTLMFHLLAVSGVVPGANQAADQRKQAIEEAAERAETIEGVFLDRHGDPITIASCNAGEPAQATDGEAFSYLIGYNSVVFGASGLRARCNTTLGKDGTGPEIHLTIDSPLQKYCYQQLADTEGSVIIMDAETGELLTMTSRASAETGFDLNQVDENFSFYNSLDSFWLDRALMAEDAPGSTFKLVSAASLLENGRGDFVCSDDGGTYQVAGMTLHNAGDASYGEAIDLQTALLHSVNIYFAKAAADKLGAAALAETAHGFLYGETFETDFGAVTSHFGLRANASKLMLTQTAFGQGPVAVSPLQICMSMAPVITAGGAIPRPYVIDHTVDEGKQSKPTRPETLSAPISERTASTLRDMLHNVAVGYGFDPDRYGFVTAKTGTATQANGQNHLYLLCGVTRGDEHLCILVDRRNTNDTSDVLLPVMEAILDYLATC